MMRGRWTYLLGFWLCLWAAFPQSASPCALAGAMAERGVPAPFALEEEAEEEAAPPRHLRLSVIRAKQSVPPPSCSKQAFLSSGHAGTCVAQVGEWRRQAELPRRRPPEDPAPLA